MRLFWSSRSPYARKVMVAAHEAGLAPAITLCPAVVTLRTRHDEIVAANPLGQVPTLITDDGAALYDSSVIGAYFAELAPNAGLLPLDRRINTLRRQALGDGVTDALIRWYSERSRADARSAAFIAVCRAKLMAAVAHLEKSGDVASGPPTLGDIALACALLYADFRLAEADWRDGHPRTALWLADLSRRPSFVATAFAG